VPERLSRVAGWFVVQDGNIQGEGLTTRRWKNPMTIKTLSAIAIVAAALSSPAFAQDMSGTGAMQKPAHAARHFRNAYNQTPGFYAGARAGDDWFTDNYGLDHSRPGDRDPDFNPAN
jgi:hypothetical protein